MKVLVPLDASDLGERAAATMATWARSASLELHLLSVIHPDEIHDVAKIPVTAEFLKPEGQEAGHISPMESNPNAGPLVAASGDPRPPAVEDRGQALERARLERKDYLESVAARLPAGLETSIHVEFSDKTARAILEVAKKLGVDAIAMTTHGRTGIRHVLMGSVAERVVRESTVPVVLFGPHTAT